MATSFEDTDFSHAEAERLLEEGRSLRQKGQALAALDPLRRALSHWQRDPAAVRSLAECHLEIGWALQHTYQPDESLVHLEEGLRLFEGRAGTEREQARCLSLIAQALWSLAHYETAIVRQEKALSLLEPLPGTAREQGICIMNLGVILSLLGRHEEAILKHEEALALHRQVQGTEVDQARCHLNVGGCLGQLQRPAESLERLGTAFAILRDVPHTEVLQALCCERVGLANWDLGRYEEAIDTLERALELLRRVEGSERAQAKHHAHIGSILTYLGRYAGALQKHTQALTLYQLGVGNERQQAWSYVEIGRNLIGLARHGEAIQQLESALALFQPIQGTAREQAFCIHTMGQALAEMGRADEALAKYDEAMALLEAIDAPALDRAAGHRLAGEALRRGGEPEAALARFDRALALYEPEQDREELWQAWYGAGQAREALGDAAGAVSAYLDATEYLEGLRDDVAARANKVAFFQDKAAVYGRLIVLLLEGGRREGFSLADPRLTRWGESPEAIALAFAEAAKARALSDLLRERPVSEAAPPEWVAEEERLGEEVARLYAELRALGREPGEPGRRLRERIQALELERDILEVRIRRAAPRAMLPSPLRSVAEIQSLLEPDTALLEYALLPAPAGAAPGSRLQAPGPMVGPAASRSATSPPGAWRLEPGAGAERLALWIVTRDGLRAFLIELPAAEGEPELPQMVRRLRVQPGRLSLAERVRLYRYPMERRLRVEGKLSVREHQRAGRLLADALLPPEAREHLAATGVRQLAIVPDGILHHVPFAALILQEDPASAAPRYEACRFLVHDYAIACVPSAMALAALRRAATERRARGPDYRRSLLAFADPVFGASDPRWRSAPEAPSDSFLATYYQHGGLDDQRLPATASEACAVAALFPDTVIYGAGELTSPPAPPRSGEGCLSSSGPASLGAGKIVNRLPLPASGRGQGGEVNSPCLRGEEIPVPPQSEVYLGLAATKERLRAAKLAEFRYLIFATHAYVDEENPMLSCIRLTATGRESGFLPAQEIFGLELDAELVTLSACRSGLGRLARGEGIVGLSTAFFSAGARSLLTSLWKVLDEPTAILVERLYAHLRSGELSRAQALQQAQLEMIAASPGHAHPFFWAFTLTGDWAAGLPAAGT